MRMSPLRARVRGVVTGVTLALATSPALAQGNDAAATREMASEALRGCMALRDPQERLICYDTTLGRTPTELTDDELQAQQREAQTPGAEAGPPPSPPSALARRWQLVAQTDRGPFVITPHRPTYLLPLSYSPDPNETVYAQTGPERLDRLELTYQISFKTKLWPDLMTRRGDLWLAYTQKSFWQAYNGAESSPFRETNYEPELIYAYKTGFDVAGLQARVLTLGLSHMSNGRSDPLSRSWNRLTLGALFDHGAFALNARGWWRIPESAEEDDNPGISEFYGRGELRGHYRAGSHSYSVTLRSTFGIDAPLRGSVEIGYSVPLWGGVKGYAQVFHGYGDGLINYDFRPSRFSLGVMLVDWL